MSTWFYVDGGQNRQGPVSAEALAEAYRLGQVGQDSLVWREGLSEWVPLRQFRDELGLAGVAPVAPPVPPMAAPAAMAPAKKGNGCLIAAIVVVGAGILLIPILAILAAIALPAYQDYIARSQTTSALADIRPLVMPMESFYQNTGRCPRDADEIGAESQVSGTRGRSTIVTVGEDSVGRCQVEGQIVGGNPTVNGSSLRLVRQEDGTWSCSSDLGKPKYLPTGCSSD